MTTNGGALFRLARPEQWTKNLIVFAAPAAAGVLTDPGSLGRAAASFGLFSLVSSGTYFLNDSIDAEADRSHPVKRKRPIAAGLVTVRAGIAGAIVLLVVGVGLGFFLSWRLALVLAIYVVVQLAYSLRLKHEPVFDLACIAAGFLLRAIAGGVAVAVPVSEWFLIVATFGSLLMVTGKRLAEQQELGASAGVHRATLDLYSPSFLRTVLAIAAGGAMLGYSQWAFSLQTALKHHHDPIWYQLSIAPMILGLLRYTYLVEAGKGAKPDELVRSEPSLVGLGVVWAVLFALGVYAS